MTTVARGNRTGLPAPLAPAASVVAIAASSVAAAVRHSITGNADWWLLLAGMTPIPTGCAKSAGSVSAKSTTPRWNCGW
jgi:uncharacterized membrane protein YfcA